MARELDVWVDRDVCISSAFCVAAAPEDFELDDNQQSHATDSPLEETDELWDALEGCPVEAIQAEDADTGEQVFPPE